MDSTLYFICTVLIVGIAAENSEISDEYCISETFDPKCQQGEVLLVTHARYGRIKLGKCVKKDYGFLGCSGNVLQFMDNICSGKEECKIDVADQELIDQVPCLEELSPYLEAGYICQTVIKPQKDLCHTQEIIEAEKKNKFLSSAVSMDTKCGLHKSPWVLQAKKGQQIEVGLIDFSWMNSSDNCNSIYGYMLDTKDDIINICGGGQRQRHLYLSEGNILQISMHESALEQHRFLLSFKAVGCPDYEAPAHSWLEPINDTIIVNCLSSTDTWTLKCVENNWLGVIGICPATTTEPTTVLQSTVKEIAEVYKLPDISQNHVLAFSFGCATVMICCIIVIVGYYCTKRYEISSKMKTGAGQQMLSAENQMTLMPTLYRSVKRKNNHAGATTQPPSYTAANNQQAPPVPQRMSSYRGDMSESMMSDYLAPQGGEDNSVKYYILENPAESGGKEEMYQSIHLFSSLERAPNNV